MENLWPTIHEGRNTEEILTFLNETIESLKNNYDGKIGAQMCSIEYVLEDRRSYMEKIYDMLPKNEAPKKFVKNEVESEIEKNRSVAYVAKCSYKYEIYNDKLFYRLFDITIPDFYPVKVEVSSGILAEEAVSLKINSLAQMRQEFINIVSSEKVKMLITKMITNDK